MMDSQGGAPHPARRRARAPGSQERRRPASEGARLDNQGRHARRDTAPAAQPLRLAHRLRQPLQWPSKGPEGHDPCPGPWTSPKRPRTPRRAAHFIFCIASLALLAQRVTPSGCAPSLMPPARSPPANAGLRACARASARERELNPLALAFGFCLSSEVGIPSQGEAKPSKKIGWALDPEPLAGLPSAIPRERVALTCVALATTHGRHRLGSGAAFHGSSSPRCPARASRPALPCQLPPVQPESLARSGLTEKAPEATGPT